MMTPEDGPVNIKKLESLPVIGRVFKRGPRIPVVRLAGVIADGAAMRRNTLSYVRVEKTLGRAFALSRSPAVALVINSPGGMPAQSQLIAGLVRQLSAEHEKPVLAFVEDVAASGGYWLACAADEIFVQETSIVGSVGVISSGFGFEDAIERYGIKRRLYTAGHDKSMLDPFLPEKPNDVDRLRVVQSQIHAAFIDWVRDRRGGRLNGADEDLFEGRFWTGQAAIEMGIADAIGDVRATLRDRYGEDVTLVDFTPGKRRMPFSFCGIDGGILADRILDTLESRTAWSRFGF